MLIIDAPLLFLVSLFICSSWRWTVVFFCSVFPALCVPGARSLPGGSVLGKPSEMLCFGLALLLVSGECCLSSLSVGGFSL
jgi:hypothetical protein